MKPIDTPDDQGLDAPASARQPAIGGAQRGTLIGIGIGPGDPDLITLKALKVLNAAPVLAYPAPDTGASLARAIVAPHLDGHHTEICIRMPMVTARFPAQEVYDWAAEEIAVHLDAGRDVVCV